VFILLLFTGFEPTTPVSYSPLKDDGSDVNKAVFSAVFRVTWSFRNHHNMVICCSSNIYDYYQCWKLWLWKPWYNHKPWKFGYTLFW